MIAGLLLLLASLVAAEPVKTIFNPFSGKLDFITQVTSGTLPSGSTYYIQNSLNAQPDSHFNVSSGTVRGALTVSTLTVTGKDSSGFSLKLTSGVYSDGVFRSTGTRTAFIEDIAGGNFFKGGCSEDQYFAGMTSGGLIQCGADPVIIDGDTEQGNEVIDATNATLLRSGAGSLLSPYTLALNLGSTNTWTAAINTVSSVTAYNLKIYSTATISGNTFNVTVGSVGLVNIDPQATLDIYGSFAVGTTTLKSTASANGDFFVGQNFRVGLDYLVPNNSAAFRSLTSPLGANIFSATLGGFLWTDVAGANRHLFSAIGGESWVNQNLVIGNTASVSPTGLRMQVWGRGNTSATANFVASNSDFSHFIFLRDDGRMGLDTVAPAYGLDFRSDGYFSGQFITGGTMTVGGQDFSVGTSTNFAVVGGSASLANMLTVGGWINGREGLVAVGTGTIQGNAFSVGGSTLTVNLGQVGIRTTKMVTGLHVSTGVFIGTTTTDGMLVGYGTAGGASGDLEFIGAADYRVAAGRYAFRFATSELAGIRMDTAGNGGVNIRNTAGEHAHRFFLTGAANIGLVTTANAVSTFTATGYFIPAPRTLAQIRAETPTAGDVGGMLRCTDCAAPHSICQSTGTTIQGFRLGVSGTAECK